MFYSGATFESHEAPAGLAGLQSGTEVEGLRYSLAPFYWPVLQEFTRSMPISHANPVRDPWNGT